jgi:hypothetical protein
MLGRFLPLFALAFAAGRADAQDHAIAAKVGFLGVGVEFTNAINDRLGVSARRPGRCRVIWGRRGRSRSGHGRLSCRR